MKRFALVGCSFFLILGYLGVSRVNAEETTTDIRVMSFNIRYGTASDGENHWEHRKNFLTKTIRTFSPDLLGTQETLGFQRDYLAEQLPEYVSLGVGRIDGGSDGEMTALFYRRDRFEKLDSGHFWLSEAPSQVGSISWDSSLPRMATWVKLRDLRAEDESAIFFFNTHFDHRGVVARIESARLLRQKISEAAKDGRVLVTGDFNADEGSEPHQLLFGSIGEAESPLLDSYRVVHPLRDKNEGTFSGFKAGDSFGPRIDWIGLTRDWKVFDAQIDRTSKDGATPSDHFPVTVIISSNQSAEAIVD